MGPSAGDLNPTDARPGRQIGRSSIDVDLSSVTRSRDQLRRASGVFTEKPDTDIDESPSEALTHRPVESRPASRQFVFQDPLQGMGMVKFVLHG